MDELEVNEYIYTRLNLMEVNIYCRIKICKGNGAWGSLEILEAIKVSNSLGRRLETDQ